jgi:hypothetical protein
MLAEQLRVIIDPFPAGTIAVYAPLEDLVEPVSASFRSATNAANSSRLQRLPVAGT